MRIVVYFICKLFLSQLVMDIPGALLRAVFAIILIFMELVGDFTFFDTIRTKTGTFALISFSSSYNLLLWISWGGRQKKNSFRLFQISHFRSLTKMTKLI